MVGRTQTSRQPGAAIFVMMFITLTISTALTMPTGTTSQTDGDSVRLLESVILDDGQSEVLLSQVAELNGPLAEALGDLVVCTIESKHRTTRHVRIDELRELIAKSGANLGLLAVSGSRCLIRPPINADHDEESPLKGPVAIDPYAGMQPASDYFSLTTLRGLVARNVAQVQFARQRGTILVRFDENDALVLDGQATDREYEIRPMATPDTSHIPIEIIEYDGPHVERTLRVSVDVAIERTVVVTTRTISAGRPIGVDDVNLVSQIIDPHPTNPVNLLEDVIGMDARGRLSKGQIIRAHDLEEPVALQRGAKVTLRARSGSFIFRMPGQLLEDARPGQIVRVRRLTDRLEMNGRLEADGEINISTSQTAQRENR